ncbi:hypothetical protein U3938_09765 [Escherichia coli]|uniref:hypothetical protein n=1 Tax=Escherichia coli TaxID=562 RepID=UPI002D77A300|nr:hypothetical protein [Escherichia coli]WRQ37947.1 hypothetical protein U3938_09765 [Escherichia coli]
MRQFSLPLKPDIGMVGMGIDAGFIQPLRLTQCRALWVVSSVFSARLAFRLSPPFVNGDDAADLAGAVIAAGRLLGWWCWMHLLLLVIIISVS